MALSARIDSFINDHVDRNFHQRRFDKLDELGLDALLARLNPYLLKAKANWTAPRLLQHLLAAHLSSSDETLFGNVLKPIAVFICRETFGGRDPRVPSVDVEFRNGTRNYALFIKSGPSWGNSKQVTQLIADFNNAPRRRGMAANVEFINGCCYGRSRTVASPVYRMLCGEAFWEFISNNPTCYQEVLAPLTRGAGTHDRRYSSRLRLTEARLTSDFQLRYGSARTGINWHGLVQENSGR